MDGLLHFLGNGGVNQSMTSNHVEAIELGRDDPQPIVPATASGSCVAAVQVALIFNLELRGQQGCSEQSLKSIASSHERYLVAPF